MYAVVYKNRVIVGPMDWNRGIFQGSLEKEGIKNTIPRVPPEQLPYIVTEDAKVMSVIENRPTINPMVEYYYGPLWEITETNAVANYEIHDSPLDGAKVNFRNQAADERYKKEISGTKVTLNGIKVSLNTDRASRDQFVQKLVAIGQNTINWKFPEAWLTLSKTDLETIVETIDNHVQTAFDWEFSKNQEIDAATTKQELVAIQIFETSQE